MRQGRGAGCGKRERSRWRRAEEPGGGGERSLVYHLKLSFQLKPPQVMSLAVMYSKLSSEITSITGQTTDLRFLAEMRQTFSQLSDCPYCQTVYCQTFYCQDCPLSDRPLSDCPNCQTVHCLTDQLSDCPLSDCLLS